MLLVHFLSLHGRLTRVQLHFKCVLLFTARVPSLIEERGQKRQTDQSDDRDRRFQQKQNHKTAEVRRAHRELLITSCPHPLHSPLPSSSPAGCSDPARG